MYKAPSLPPRPLVGRRAEPSATPPGCRTYQSVNQCDTLTGSRDCLHCPVHGSSGLRPSTCGYGAGTHKGCFVPHSSLLDEWLRCLSNASPPALVSSMLSFYSFYVHKFVAVAGTKPFLERQEHSNIFSKHLKCEASPESQKN